jgi:hypothetical protein
MLILNSSAYTVLAIPLHIQLYDSICSDLQAQLCTTVLELLYETLYKGERFERDLERFREILEIKRNRSGRIEK